MCGEGGSVQPVVNQVLTPKSTQMLKLDLNLRQNSRHRLSPTVHELRAEIILCTELQLTHKHTIF